MNENHPDKVDDILTTLRVLGIDLETESFSSMLDELPIFLWYMTKPIPSSMATVNSGKTSARALSKNVTNP